MTQNTTQSPIDTVIAAFESRHKEIVKKGIYFETNCPGPNHNNGDSHPSLHFWEVTDDNGNATVAFKCFSGNCSRADILKALGTSLSAVPGAPTHNYARRPVLTLDDVQKHTMIDWHVLFNVFGVQDGVETFHKGYKPYKERGVIIPYYNEDGTEYARRKIRLTLGKESPRFKWSEGDEDTKIPYGLQYLHKAREAGYLVILEGESDYWTLYVHGFPSLAVSGAGNESALNGSILNDIPRIYVIQEMTEDAGRKFPYKVKGRLLATGYTGEVLRVPLLTLTGGSKTGAKDPNALHKKLYKQMVEQKSLQLFKDTFQQCLDQAKPMDDDTGMDGQETEEQTDVSRLDQVIEEKDVKTLLSKDIITILAQVDKLQYAVYKQQIRENFGRLVNLNDLNAAVNEQRKKVSANSTLDERKDLDSVAQLFHDRHMEEWSYDPQQQAWLQWNGKYWKVFDTKLAEKLALDEIFSELLHECDFDVNSNSTLDCVHRRAMEKCRRTLYPTEEVVNFNNGTLFLDSMELKPHCKDDDLTYCLFYDYAPGEHPTITKFLRSVLHSEVEEGVYQFDPFAMQALMGHTGLSLIQDRKLQNVLYLKGAPGAGKSTILDLTNLTTGVTSNPRVKRYASHDIFSEELEGKRSRYDWYRELMACVDELPVDSLRGEQTYKSMSAHGGVSVRGIGRDEVRDNQWRPKLLIACNEAPSFKDMTGAVKRRNIYIQMPYEVARKDRNAGLIDEMIKEIGAYAHNCILLALEIRERGYYPQSAAMLELSARVSANGNPLKLFVEDHCLLGKDENGALYTIGSTELWEYYKAYCERSGYKYPLAQNSFVTSLKDMNKGITQPKSPVPDPLTGKQKRVLRGIGYMGGEYLGATAEFANDTLLSTTIQQKYTDLYRLSTDLLKVCHAPLDGSASGTNTPVNINNYRLTDFSSKTPVRTPYTLSETSNNKGVGVSYKGYKDQKSVSPSSHHVDEPVVRSETYTHPVESLSQACNKSVDKPVSHPYPETVVQTLDQLFQDFKRRLSGSTDKILWNIPNSGFSDGMVEPKYILSRVSSLIKGGDRQSMTEVERFMRSYLEKEA
jgi:phage/plasmid-associated DNA primase